VNAFLMHVGGNNTIDLSYTVSRKRTIDELLTTLSKDSPERVFFDSEEFQSAFPSGEFNCWGIPERAEPSFRKTEIGDIVLFFPEIGANGSMEYVGVVKSTCPFRCHQASRILWPATPNERLFPWLFFFDTETVYVAWDRFLDDVGYKPNWNPRGWYRRIGSDRFASWGGEVGYLANIRKAYTATSNVLPSETAFVTEMVAAIAGKPAPITGQGFNISPEVRQAIEQASMNIAIAHYQERGWTVTDVSRNRPYDLKCAKDDLELHVEVKGTTSDGAQILLTPNEVEHARNYENVALFVVSNLITSEDAEGKTTVSAGRIKLLFPWTPVDDELSPIGFSYQVP